MVIHRVSENESLEEIAHRYLASPDRIREVNGLLPRDNLIIGEELLIPMPTRTYTVKSKDTLTAIGKRFGVKRGELLAANPYLAGTDSIYTGESLAIRYQNEGLGMAAANGYLTEGCKRELLSRALPYLVYVTVVGGIFDGENIKLRGRDKELPAALRGMGKIPLLRIYDKSDASYLSESEHREKFADKMIDAARCGGYSGIVLAAPRAVRENCDGFRELVMATRKGMIGCDLILFLEADEATPPEVTELADGAILSYTNLGEENPPPFYDKVIQPLQQFAECAEGSRALLDIAPYALSERGYIPIGEAVDAVRRRGDRIRHTDESKIAYTEDGRTVFEPLSNIKAKLTALGELGFMGISFDIANTPVSYLMLFHTMFSPIVFA